MKGSTTLYLVGIRKTAGLPGRTVDIFETLYVCTSRGDAETLQKSSGPRAVISTKRCKTHPAYA